VDLDASASHLESVTCDLDGTSLSLKFKHREDAIKWYVHMEGYLIGQDHFIVGGAQWNCTMKDKKSLLLRRVVGASEPHVGDTVKIQTSLARYDEIYETADIAYSTADAPECQGVSKEADKKICLGYNGDCDTGSAKASIPLYSNSIISAACSDCYATLEADVFVSIKIGGWELQDLQGGFKGVTLNTSIVLDAKATKQWSLGLDKTLPVVPQTDLVNFKVGSVPFLLYFEIPMEVTGDLSFNGDAEATFGAKAHLSLGDAYIEWNPTSKWNHTTPKPVFGWTPELTTTASADLTGSFGIKPSFGLHFDKLFSYSLVANPSIQAEVKSDSTDKTACLTSTYSADVVSAVDLDINIPLVGEKEWKWGPTTVYSTTGQSIPNKCVNITV